MGTAWEENGQGLRWRSRAWRKARSLKTRSCSFNSSFNKSRFRQSRAGKIAGRSQQQLKMALGSTHSGWSSNLIKLYCSKQLGHTIQAFNSLYILYLDAYSYLDIGFCQEKSSLKFVFSLYPNSYRLKNIDQMNWLSE